MSFSHPRLCRGLTRSKLRNLVAFWFFGLGNNFSYVIMLSAALDIIGKQEKPSGWLLSSNRFHHNCTHTGTASVLLADILPSMAVKLTAPLFIHRLHFHLKIILSAVLAINSFLMVSFSTSMAISIAGIISASFSCGIGDVSFISMTAFFDKDCVSAWSSGTGAAGLVGSLIYAALTSALNPEATLLILNTVPVFLLFVYFFVLRRPAHPKFRIRSKCTLLNEDEIPVVSYDATGAIENLEEKRTASTSPRGIEDPAFVLPSTGSEFHEVLLRDQNPGGSICSLDTDPRLSSVSITDLDLHQIHPSLQAKLAILKDLAGLLVWLSLVYFFEYLINQSLFELIIFTDTISETEQYRWYQVLYQTGVFLSRSSVNILQIRWTWLLAVLQAINFILCLTQVIYRYIPSIWIMFVLILYEGLLGGLAYVNTFYRIIQETTPAYREYAMAFAAVSDSIGIMLAGVVAIPLRNCLCSLLS